MREFAGKMFGGPAAETPLGQAQDLMYKAFEIADIQERIKLAKRAIELSPDCADAYVVLAENAAHRKEALEFYEKGVAAGERALGPKAFQEDVGHFWGLLETRPYMRAGKVWLMPSGRWRDTRRRSLTSRNCSDSTPTITREPAMPWPHGSCCRARAAGLGRRP